MNRNLAQIFKIGLVLLSLTAFIAAQNKVVPIVYFNPDNNPYFPKIESGVLLGGTENGKWLDAETAFGKVETDGKFSLFDFDGGEKGEFLLGAIKKGSFLCSDKFHVEPQINVSANFAVGANADWKIFPRVPKKVSTGDANYRRSVAAVLRSHGLTKSPVKINQALRVDLDGDGVEEVILETLYIAQNSDDDGTSRGSYSALIIRKIVRGKVRNLLVDGYFQSKKYAEAESGGDYALAGIADLNGDGKLELVVDIRGFEEHGAGVYEIKNGKILAINALYYHCSG